VPFAPHDAEVLLAHLLGVDRAHLRARPEEPVEEMDAARYRELLERRASRVPLQHLTGTQEFWSLPFHVSPAVLIPRPESEHLIEAFLSVNGRPDPLILDVGTGSGCLAVAAAREIPGALVHATDISEEALMIARLNASDNDVAGRIAFYHGDLFEPLRGRGLEGKVDVVLCNPPYVSEQELAGLEPEVRDHEPRAALTPGPDGLVVHRRLAREAPPFLAAGGHLIVEFGLGQEAAVREIYGGSVEPGAAAGRAAGGPAARAGGPTTGGPAHLEIVEIRRDLAGIPRVLVARRPMASL
jgi:release factor glutamine methyltransferase